MRFVAFSLLSSSIKSNPSKMTFLSEPLSRINEINSLLLCSWLLSMINPSVTNWLSLGASWARFRAGIERELREVAAATIESSPVIVNALVEMMQVICDSIGITVDGDWWERRREWTNGMTDGDPDSVCGSETVVSSRDKDVRGSANGGPDEGCPIDPRYKLRLVNLSIFPVRCDLKVSHYPRIRAVGRDRYY